LIQNAAQFRETDVVEVAKKYLWGICGETLGKFPPFIFFRGSKTLCRSCGVFVCFWGGGGGWVVHCEEVDMATIALPRVQCFLLLPRTSGVSSHFGIRASLGSPLRCGRVPDGFCGAPVNSAIIGSGKR
jgi:hypothetical protein